MLWRRSAAGMDKTKGEKVIVLTVLISAVMWIGVYLIMTRCSGPGNKERK